MMPLPLCITGRIILMQIIQMRFSILTITKVQMFMDMLMLVFGSTYDLARQINDVCSFGTELSIVNPSILTVVGEFTGAQTDCCPVLRYH